jgi:PAS domain S-box-containing protein
MRIIITGKKFDLDYKATILIMRWLVVLLVIFMAVHSTKGFDFFSPNYLLAMVIVAANALISLTPAGFFERTWFTYLLFIIDIGFVSAMIYFSEGINTDFYLVYFLSIFMSSIGRSVSGAIPVAVITSAIYGWLVYRQGGLEMMAQPSFWLRVPFFMLVALFSSLWASQVECEKKKKEEAEHFKRRLEEEIETATQEIRKTSENYKILKEYNENILASIASGVLVVDMDGVATTFNREASRILKIPQTAIVGKNIDELPQLFPLARYLRQALDTGRQFQLQEMRLNLENDREVVLAVSVSILKEQTPRSNGAIAIFQDITATKMLEEKVKQTEKLAVLGEMAAVMAHEIRNPLNAIAGFAQLLQAKKDTDSRIARFVEIIVQEAFRIDAIISDILDFAHRKKLSLGEVNIGDVIGKITGNGHLAKDEKEVELSVRLSDGLPTVKGDAVRLERVLINLINNARESIKGKGRVVIRAEAEQQEETAGVRITVADNGQGIPPEMMDKIFQPFFTTKSKGTGLGLAIIQRIVEEHRGRLTVESRPGEGTEFSIFLPAAAA